VTAVDWQLTGLSLWKVRVYVSSSDSRLQRERERETENNGSDGKGKKRGKKELKEESNLKNKQPLC
jgi:hypothetical protein